MHYQQENLLHPVISVSHHYSHGVEEPSHSHTVAQVLHIISGVLRVNVDNTCWVIPPSRGLWIPAHTPHRVQSVGAVSVRALFLDPLARADLPTSCGIFQVSGLLRELIIAAETLSQPVSSNTREERIIELILDELRDVSLTDFHVPMPTEETLRHLCERIIERIDHPWGASDAANILKVSERTISRKFHLDTGLSFGEWLRRTRLMKSMELLAAGSNVIDASLAVGYDSPSSFSTAFKRCVGLSPADFIDKS